MAELNRCAQQRRCRFVHPAQADGGKDEQKDADGYELGRPSYASILALVFPVCVRMNLLRFGHLAAALVTFQQFDGQGQERHPDQEQHHFLEFLPRVTDHPPLWQTLPLNLVPGSRTLS